MSTWTIWLIIGLVLIIAEMATFTFYLLWLGIGALAAALVAVIFPNHWILYIIVFSIVSVALTYFTKSFIKRIQGSKGYRDATDELVGQLGEVVEAIDFGSMGIVRVGSEVWSASADGPIGAGERIIVERRGTTVLHVKAYSKQ